MIISGDYPVQTGDALHNVQLDSPGQFGNDLCRLIRTGIAEHQGNGLGMLILEDHPEVLVIRLADGFKGTGPQGFGQAIHIRGGLFRAKGLFQDVLGIEDTAFGDDLLGDAESIEILDGALHILRREPVELGDLQGDLFHLVVLEIAVDLRGPVRSQGNHHSRSPLNRGQLFLFGCCSSH